jgi:murein L,D-transpeptidase YcbB/YkuD
MQSVNDSKDAYIS